MKKEIGKFTKVAKTVETILANREFITSDGECIELHNSIINNITCDMTNLILEKEENEKRNFEYKKIKDSNDSIYNVGGYFYHLLFKNILDKNFEENYIIRFCKLCSHLNYDNILIQGATKGQTKILEKDLKVIWNLSEREFINTRNYLIKNNLIFINEDRSISVNKEFAVRGSVERNKDMTRVFIDGFNELYNGVSARQHSMLATFIKILPYLNTKYNILCENPNEADKELIKPLKWSEIGEKIGLDKKQSRNLKGKLFKLRINNKKVIAEWTDDKGIKIVVNPSVFWKSNTSNISDVAKLFEI